MMVLESIRSIFTDNYPYFTGHCTVLILFETPLFSRNVIYTTNWMISFI